MVMDYLKRAVEDQASDLFIVAGGCVCEKLDKRLVNISDGKVFAKETETLIMEIYELAGRSPERYLQRGDDDFCLPPARIPGRSGAGGGF